jgi:hypothetical protein
LTLLAGKSKKGAEKDTQIQVSFSAPLLSVVLVYTKPGQMSIAFGINKFHISSPGFYLFFTNCCYQTNSLLRKANANILLFYFPYFTCYILYKCLKILYNKKKI